MHYNNQSRYFNQEKDSCPAHIKSDVITLMSLNIALSLIQISLRKAQLYAKFEGYSTHDFKLCVNRKLFRNMEF